MSKSREENLRALFARLRAVMRGMHSGQGFRFAEFTVGPPQVRILFHVASNPDGVSVKDLAELLSVTSGAVTQFIDALVEKGLVRREEDPNDRRLLRIKLTEYAGSRFNEFRRSYFAAVSRVFNSLSDEEILQLTALLAKVNIPSNIKEPDK
ncbi:MAG: MarR family transcriptional regulator [Dehalococcoidia bacterium]|nr:MarR family transcriptional regulator [Dehalococcoidia bacterium]MDD5648638.1 MarR family transcriptional regulator [Dehalococcoidia bacterium]